MSSLTAHLLGVRGSTTAPGRAFLRYGGHTTCIAIAVDGAQPTLIIDAGTGARELARLLPEPFEGVLVLSHLHWDHTHGLPFSGALLDAHARVRILVPAADGEDPLDLLLPGISPPAFPVPVDELAPGWSFDAAPTHAQLGDLTLRTAVIRHKGGRTVGVRIEHDGRSIAVMSDHDLAEPDPGALELARGADVLLHDSQYLASEIEPFRGFGHSTIERACAFADEAAVGRLVLTHHAPGRTDDELDAIERRFRSTPHGRPVSVAREGEILGV